MIIKSACACACSTGDASSISFTLGRHGQYLRVLAVPCFRACLGSNTSLTWCLWSNTALTHFHLSRCLWSRCIRLPWRRCIARVQAPRRSLSVGGEYFALASLKLPPVLTNARPLLTNSRPTKAPPGLAQKTPIGGIHKTPIGGGRGGGNSGAVGDGWSCSSLAPVALASDQLPATKTGVEAAAAAARAKQVEAFIEAEVEAVRPF